MMMAHLFIAGFVEGAVTALVLKFVWKSSPELVQPVNPIAVGGK